MSLFGPPDVEKLKAKGDIKGLVKALGYQKDREVRDRAAEALGEIGAPAVEPPIAALGDQNEEVRTFAASALGTIGDARAVEALGHMDARAVKALGNTAARARLLGLPRERLIGEYLRHLATEWWAGQPESRAVATCDACSSEPVVRGEGYLVGSSLWCVDCYIDKDVEGSLRRNPDAAGYGALQEAQSWAQSFAKTGGSARIERLIAALKDPDDRVRQRTWQTLGKVRDPDDFERLIVALKDPDFNVRVGVSKALGLTRDPRAVEPLIAALKVTDKDEVERWYAAESLGRIGDPRAVEPLIAALNDSYDPVRFAAAHSLGQIGDPRAVEPLVARLEDVVERVRWEAARALRKLDDPRGAEAHAGLKEESKAQRLRDQAQLASVPSAGGGTVLRDGDHVTCCVCNRQALVKVVGKKQRIDIIGPEQIESLRRQNVALQCQKCGVFVCFSCASSTSDAMGMMWCPKCNEAAGPSFIKGD